MNENKDEHVAFQVRLPRPLWRELKLRSVDTRLSMANQVVVAVERYLEEEREQQAR